MTPPPPVAAVKCTIKKKGEITGFADKDEAL